MRASIKKFGRKSCHERVYPNGYRILISYATPVGAFVPGIGYLKTNKRYSRTTTEHLQMWLEGAHSTPVSPADLRKELDFLDSLKMEV